MTKHEQEIQAFRDATARFQAVPVDQRRVPQYFRRDLLASRKLSRMLDRELHKYPGAEVRTGYLGVRADGSATDFVVVVTPGETETDDVIHYAADDSWMCPPFCRGALPG